MKRTFKTASLALGLGLFASTALAQSGEKIRIDTRTAESEGTEDGTTSSSPTSR